MKGYLCAVTLVAALTCAHSSYWPSVGGSGVVALTDNSVGLFNFHASVHGALVRGGLQFTEVVANPDGTTTAVNKVQMKVTSVVCAGGEAVIKGTGCLNKSRATFEVYVVDNGVLSDPPDAFAIRAYDAAGNAIYEAFGPVVEGNLWVRCAPPARGF